MCTMRCVTKATPFQFTDGNKLKSCRTGLTNHILMPLGADTQTDRHTRILTREQNDFKKPGACSQSAHAWFK